MYIDYIKCVIPFVFYMIELAIYMCVYNRIVDRTVRCLNN